MRDDTTTHSAMESAGRTLVRFMMADYPEGSPEREAIDTARGLLSDTISELQAIAAEAKT